MKILKEIDLFAVLYNKENGLCALKRQISDRKLKETLRCQKFAEKRGTDSLILKMEKNIKNTLIDMKKQDLINNKTSKLRTRGTQPAKLHRLAKTYKRTPLQPVLLTRGSSYQKLMRNWSLI